MVSNVSMRTISWRWTLALVQIALATVALVYAPYEYRARPHPIGDDFMLAGYRQLWPPPILRMSYALNFPALTSVIPLRFTNWSSRDMVNYQGPPFVSLTVEDCIFLTLVGVLWYLIGSRLDRRKHATSKVLTSKSSRISALTLGCLFAGGVGTFASYCVLLTDADRPFRQIGVAGLAWAVALLWFFASRLITVLRTSSGKHRIAM